MTVSFDLVDTLLRVSGYSKKNQIQSPRIWYWNLLFLSFVVLGWMCCNKTWSVELSNENPSCNTMLFPCLCHTANLPSNKPWTEVERKKKHMAQITCHVHDAVIFSDYLETLTTKKRNSNYNHKHKGFGYEECFALIFTANPFLKPEINYYLFCSLLC